MQEHEYWKGVRTGDRDAFEKLYNDYYGFLFAEGFRLCGNKELVKDSLHEVLLETWMNREKLPPVTYVGAYLKTHLRRKIMVAIAKDSKTSFEWNEENSTQAELPYEALLVKLEENKEMKARIERALSALTTAQRQAVEMKFFRSMSYDEIAGATGASSRTIYNQVYEALKTMRRMLRILLML